MSNISVTCEDFRKPSTFNIIIGKIRNFLRDENVQKDYIVLSHKVVIIYYYDKSNSFVTRKEYDTKTKKLITSNEKLDPNDHSWQSFSYKVFYDILSTFRNKSFIKKSKKISRKDPLTINKYNKDEFNLFLSNYQDLLSKWLINKIV